MQPAHFHVDQEHPPTLEAYHASVLQLTLCNNQPPSAREPGLWPQRIEGWAIISGSRHRQRIGPNWTQDDGRSSRHTYNVLRREVGEGRKSTDVTSYVEAHRDALPSLFAAPIRLCLFPSTLPPAVRGAISRCCRPRDSTQPLPERGLQQLTRDGFHSGVQRRCTMYIDPSTRSSV